MTLQGACTALVTPFKKGKVDEECFVALIKRQIANGVSMVAPMGTTGESPTLSHDKHERCIELAVETCRGSGCKVVAGAGSNSTKEAVSLSRFAEKKGADALLSITPYYNKPTQEGLFEHYKALAKAVSIPIMLYNVPGRTGVDLKPETVARLVKVCPNITMIKEASGSMERCVELGVNVPDVAVFSGEDSINGPILLNGGRGVVSVTSNLLPNLVSEMVAHALEGRYAEAKAINDRLFAINKALFLETNPIPIKAAMFMAGLMPVLEYRLPLVRPSDATMKRLEAAMVGLNIPGAVSA